MGHSGLTSGGPIPSCVSCLPSVVSHYPFRPLQPTPGPLPQCNLFRDLRCGSSTLNPDPRTSSRSTFVLKLTSPPPQDLLPPYLLRPEATPAPDPSRHSNVDSTSKWFSGRQGSRPSLRLVDSTMVRKIGLRRLLSDPPTTPHETALD